MVHHYIALRIEPILDALFVEQGNVSKNCRKGEGNLKMVQEVAAMVREVSEDKTITKTRKAMRKGKLTFAPELGKRKRR